VKQILTAAHKRQGQQSPWIFCTNTTLEIRLPLQFVTADETWFHHIKPKSKWLSKEWHYMTSSRTKKIRVQNKLEKSWQEEYLK
jgi:hypothetical protein